MNKRKPAQPLSTNSSHLAGEYFVAAELYRRGYEVGITIGNAKAIDIFAVKGRRKVLLQVKAIRDKKSIGWPISWDRIEDGIVYVFVLVNPPDQKPSYFILSAEEARENVKQYETRGILNLHSVKSSRFRNRWDKI